MKRALLALAFLLLAAGCAGADDETTAGYVYWIRDDKVWPVSREIPNGIAGAIALELLRGPSDDELELGFRTALPDDLELTSIRTTGGTATVTLDDNLSPEGLAQVVYTLTQFPTVQSVDLVTGATLLTGFDRTDVEEQTPAILVESPLSFEEVTSPVRVTGTANTFEANFQYELAAGGRIIAEDFVTATSGTGTRGTFEFFVPFEHEGDGTLVVFESSAKDGSRINVSEIPLRLKR